MTARYVDYNNLDTATVTDTQAFQSPVALTVASFSVASTFATFGSAVTYALYNATTGAVVTDSSNAVVQAINSASGVVGTYTPASGVTATILANNSYVIRVVGAGTVAVAAGTDFIRGSVLFGSTLSLKY
jgi:hypothetical protein